MHQNVEQKTGPVSRLHAIYRGTIFQAVILGLISFTQPGIWSALNNLGAGGQAEPYVVNAANVITFAIMVFGAPLASVVANVIGVRWVIVFGTIGYVPYSAALYCNSAFGTQWFLIFGSVTCGLSASALWSAEATVAVGYPEPARRGICVSIWLALNKLGSIIGSAIQLALNKDGSTTGSISTQTYLVLVAIQCLGLPLAFLLSPPDKLIRTDGKKPTFSGIGRSWRAQSREFFRILRRKDMLLLIPAFITSEWGQTYQGNYLTAYFSVRSRALVGFLVAVVGAIVNILCGWWLDTRWVKRSTQARGTWLATLALFTAMWIWYLVVQVRWSKDAPSIDWSDSQFSQGAALYILLRIAFEVILVWLYWAVAAFDSDADAISVTVGILRAGQSLGEAFSYGVGAARSASLLTNLIVAFVVFFVSVPFTTWAAWIVPERLLGEDEDDDVVVGGGEAGSGSGAASDSERERDLEQVGVKVEPKE
ncbi:major facilitator superfamily domain-containing protein [Phyllosticta citribraziliensis]|uniref:Major facilitator superfamily domain-containing protein n=1 Tax=Phyllosticta citribraziliensis TaxID=989973 RepID=A0ABR1LNX0_9PEZI